jgi:hypothetical protein
MRLRKPRKILKATVGLGAITFAFVGLFPGCNLMAPEYQCETGRNGQCSDLSVEEEQDAGGPDLSDKDKS